MRYLSQWTIILLCCVVGCERQFGVVPTTATEDTYRDQIDYDQLPAETRELYHLMLDGSLPGAKASDYQSLLDTAQDIRREPKSTVYVFQLSDFDCSIEELYEEGTPFLYVKVQNKIGRIYQSDLGSPEW